MSNTTKAKILLIAPELAAITNDETWDLILSDIASEIGSSIYGSDQEKAQRYKAAHHLSLILDTINGGASGAAGGLIMDKNGDVIKQYASPMKLAKIVSPYERTTYGKEFLSIQRRHVVGFAVVTPGAE